MRICGCASLSFMKNFWAHFKYRLRQMRDDLVVLFHAVRDPAAPLPAKITGAVTIAYALSPIDLIPDVIPVLGMLDDVLLVPLGLWLTWRLMPEGLIADYRARRGSLLAVLPRSKAAAAVIVCLWALCFFAAVRLFLRH